MYHNSANIADLISNRVNFEQFAYVFSAILFWSLSIDVFITVLVLGMCFFAGGTRFQEQGFGASTFITFAEIPFSDFFLTK